MITPDETRLAIGMAFDTIDTDDIIFRLSAKGRIDFLRYVKENQGYREKCRNAKDSMRPLLELIESIKRLSEEQGIELSDLFSRIDEALSRSFSDPVAKEYVYIMMNCESIVRTREAMMVEFDVNMVKVVCDEIMNVATKICDSMFSVTI